MADLKTNYVDDVLDTTKNQLRKYQQIQNDDGTVSFVDVTEYTQVGTSFGAKDINDTNAAINDVNGKLNYKHMSIKDGMAGITIPGDWIEAWVDITFSLNPQYYFTFHLIRDNLLSTNKKYLQCYYASENDLHNICLFASATGVKLEKYTYRGQDIGRNCEMNLFYR